jgi:hypothetical protein
MVAQIHRRNVHIAKLRAPSVGDAGYVGTPDCNYDPQDMCMTMSLSSAQVPSQLRHQRHPAKRCW